VLDVQPGKVEEFLRFSGWLAASDRLDRLIEATEPQRQRVVAAAPAPAPVATVARSASLPRGVRAGCAARLARLALALHREAAAGAVLRQETEISD
jgi:hypothetical protein